MIGADGIAALIPHHGAMCLLDAVVRWDASTILCRSASHRRADNPLAQDGRLEAVCGVEYAAQAMALHGALCDAGGKPSGTGYLASLREVECHVTRLDLLAGDLDIEAGLLVAEAGRVIYRFEIVCAGRPILSGRAAVVLGVSA
jgi:predicted hotdog family 3-hydroxylacyl-ACP dehydratase